MVGIEELTKEELVTLVRKNIPDINEERVVQEVLYEQFDFTWEQYMMASKKEREVNEQIRILVEPYLDGPIKPGARLRRWPKEARTEYERLDQQRRAAQKEAKEWFEKHEDVQKRYFQNQRNRIKLNWDQLLRHD